MAKPPKLRRPARPRSTSHPFTDPGMLPSDVIEPARFTAELGNLVCEPIEVLCWWRGAIAPGGKVACRLQGGPMLPGGLVEVDGPGSGLVYKPSPATLPAPRIAGIEVDGDPDLLWKVWLKLQLGEKVYVHAPAATLTTFAFHPDRILTWPLEQVLRVELDAPSGIPAIEVGVVVVLLAHQPLR